jgi:riboflavin kinase/FMN adenylyltransferase
MRIIETTSELEKVQTGCVLTIGNFDGVHIGHRAILAAGKEIAHQRETELVVMTLEPHPLAVLFPDKAPGILTQLTLKKQLLADLGVDCLFVLKSEPELLALSPADFVEKFIVKGIVPGVVVEGEDFNFGSRRAGGIDTLKDLGAKAGFEVFVVEAREADLSTGQTVRVSSTVIRSLLEDGSVSDATIALDRPYRLIGPVVSGTGKGKRLGFPTANIRPAGQVTPAEGVYAGFVQIGENEEDVCPVKEKFPAALSIGRAETFGGDNPLMIEAHLLTEAVGDLSGKWLAIDFIKQIREQKKFENEKQLSEQIVKDCEEVKNVLAAKDTGIIES